MSRRLEVPLGRPARLSALASLQTKEGHLRPETIAKLAETLNVPVYELHGLATFFPHFHLIPPSRPRVRICRDLSCALAGSEELLLKSNRIAKQVNLKDYTPEPCPCLGHCDGGPAAEVDGRVYIQLTEEKLLSILKAQHAGRFPKTPRPLGIVSMKNLLSHQKRAGAFGVLKTLRRKGDPQLVIETLKESCLRGMGGAGFPAGTKWEIVRGTPGDEKYLICNADESEPGTFKDRAILDAVPELVVEGMLIGAWVTGARRGIIYIRHEYARQKRSLQRALRAARGAGLIGGPENPEIKIFVSPGGYICGEETALLEVLEDKRAQPRDKPPFPGTHGLFGKPTLINNVETFALIPAILHRGAAWFSALGRNGGKGYRILGISGPVKQPGAYEVELGTPIRSLIEMAGGLRDGLSLKAFSPGGVSSGFLPAAMADLPYDFKPLVEAGSMLGSGALVVIPQGTDMVALAHNAVRFFRDESCGKCVPCRAGTEKLTAFLERVLAKTAHQEELDEIIEICAAMTDASICGLGQSAPLPYMSLFRYFKDELNKRLDRYGDPRAD